MDARAERLGRDGSVKGSLLQGHLSWAAHKLGPEWAVRLQPFLDAESSIYVRHRVLATDWVPFATLVAVDKAIASAAGGDPERVYRDLGRQSAAIALAGGARSFAVDEPHRFFEQMATGHREFQNFGRCAYQRTGDRSGRVRLEGGEEYSPVFCTSAAGYYEGALALLKAPGPVRVSEDVCRCAGAACCDYRLDW